MALNIEAAGTEIYIQEPSGAQNYGIGNRANVNGVGLFEHASGFIADSDKIPNPASLYRQQLEERLTYVIPPDMPLELSDRKSTRLNSSHVAISYVVSCLK